MSEKIITIEGRDRDADLYKLTLAWVKGLEWEDCEYGCWQNDPKRPFGNSGSTQIEGFGKTQEERANNYAAAIARNVARDILEIIGCDEGPRCPHCREPLGETERLYEYAHSLFKAIPSMLERSLPKRWEG